MERVQAGCEASFDTLVSRHYAPVCGFASRMTGRPDLAPDIAQHAFAAVYRQRDSYRRGAPFRAWLYCIARRRCRQVVRQERRNQPVLLGAEFAAGPTADPHRAAERRELLQALGAALLRLPERERAAVVMFHQLQWSYQEIAEALGCSPGAARTAACRGRGRLRALMAEFEERDR